MTEHDRPQGIAQAPIAPPCSTAARPWRTLLLLCVAQFVGVLNFQIVSIALPAIQHGLGFFQEQLQWVVSANALAFGGFLLLAGRAADLFGHRRLFIVGMALFAVASLGCGLIPSQVGLIVARAFQGLGTAIATPAALALLIDTFAEGVKRNRALGIWGAVGPLGGVVSVLLGGALTTGPGWPWVFFLSVPIAVLALVLAPLLLVEHRIHAETSRLDIAGAVTATAGMILLVYSLSQVEQVGMHALWTVGLLALALALLLTFGFIERHVAHPLVPLHIFRRRTLTGANLVTVAFAAAANTPIFFFALYMQQIRGFSPLVTGLAFLPTNLTMIAGAALGTRLVNWLGARRTMVAGMGMLLASLLLLARLSVDSNYVSTLLPGLVLLGGGLGLTQVATTVAGTQRISTTQRGLASGLLNVSVQMGTALGLALLVTVATAHTGALVRAGHPQASALVAGYQWAFYTGAGLALSGALIALLMIRTQPLDPDQEEAEMLELANRDR